MYLEYQQTYACVSSWISKGIEERGKARAASGARSGGGERNAALGRAEAMERSRPWGEGEQHQVLRQWTIQLQEGHRSSAGFWEIRWPIALSAYWTASGGARWNWQKYLESRRRRSSTSSST